MRARWRRFWPTRGNDLTEAALELLPEIAEILAALGDAPGCLLARMSGSGATCFGLFESPRAAATAAATLQVGAPHWWVRATAIASGGAVAAIA